MQTIQKYFILIFTLCFFYGVYGQAPKTYSSSEILLQLKKLNTVGSVLYIAAHPDDENTRLIAYLANEKCLRTGYLSLTRGDGGQNLIGPEQGIELGIIRTQELLAARRIDGGEQFFTRAYDFGYSKTPKETFEKWNHDSILGDLVRVIRMFRPDIIITRFATDGSGGHGHHTASAMLAEEAFDAAADPRMFPDQLKEFPVWQAKRLFWNVSTRFQNPNADMSPYIKLDVGGYNPLLGKSYGEISAESRSMHKSQGFGSARQRGEYLEFFKPIKGDTNGLKTIFDGIDFTWKRVKGDERVGDSLNKIIAGFNPQKPEAIAKDLLAVSDLINWHYVIYKKQLICDLADQCMGIYSESISDKPLIAEGDTLRYNYNVICRTKTEVKQDLTIVPLSFSDYAIPGDFWSPQYDSSSGIYVINNPIFFNRIFNLKKYLIPIIPFENKFFYSKGIKDNMYVISNRYYREQPEPYLTTALSGSIQIGISHRPFSRINQISYKWTDPEKGEQIRPVIIVPPVLISIESPVVVFGEDKTKEIHVKLKAMKDDVKGIVKVSNPKGWWIEGKGGPKGLKEYLKSSEEYGRTFSFNKKGEEEVITLLVTPPKDASVDDCNVSVEIGDETYSKGMKEIKYDHIPVQTIFTDAKAKLVRLDIKHKLKRIGYIPGAGDEVQSCLSQIGYEVVTLSDAMLEKDDLSKYDAIITGVRAYNTNDKLSDYKKRLMDYVSQGGNLIVQYNTNSFAGPLKSDLGPYKFKITRDRITDEAAKVTFELPEHPVLNAPNKITDKDFEGWIQERSIYHAGEYDSTFVAPLSMSDPGEKPSKGSLIIAKHGKGNFIYTGLVFFRELPAGVPGAYRLFVNLIELGK